MTITHLLLIQTRKKALIYQKIEMIFKYLLDYLCIDSPWAGIFVYHLLSCYFLKCGAFILILVLVNLYSSVFVHTCRRIVMPKSNTTLIICNADLLVEILNNVRKTFKLKLSAPNLKHAAKKYKA